MKVKVRYFGRFAIITGKFSEELEIEEGLTIKNLIDILQEKYPPLKEETIEVSVNGKYADINESIKGEISIYPPISGG